MKKYSKLSLTALFLVLVLTSCKRVNWNMANVPAPHDAPQYTVEPDINSPGGTK